MRLIAQELGKRWGQQVVVENKPGAGATIGAEIVAKAPPDGYTLLLASQTNAISASLYKKLTLRCRSRTSRPSRSSAASRACWSCNPSLPVKTLPEFIAYVKARPGQVDYASSGNGSGQHLFMAMLASMTGMQMSHVPYKGSGQATDRSAGRTGDGIDPGHRRHGRAHQGGQAPPARGHGLDAIAAIAGRADRRRAGRPGLRSLRLDGPAGAEGHACSRSSTRSTATSRRCSRQPRSRRTWPRRASRSSGSTPAEFGAFFRPRSVGEGRQERGEGR